MTKKRKNSRNKNNQVEQNYSIQRPGVISFGEPEPILTTGTDYNHVYYDNNYDYWQLPIDRLSLSQLPNLNGQHGGVIYARRNMITCDYLDGGLSAEQLEGCLLDYLLFGDVPILKVRNGWGEVIGLEPLPSLYMRRRKTEEFVILQKGPPLVYPPEDIIFLKQYDPQQQIYGLPDYIGGIHSVLLNSEATIFRRRYYHNGAHMGFILYANDPNISNEVEQEIKNKIEQSKGVGNFRNMFISIPKGDPDGIKIINIGDVSAADEFSNIKSITAQDVFTAHRFPAGLGGIIPTNGVVMPNPETVRDTYRKDEAIPVQRKFANAIKSDPEIPASLHLLFKITD
ncbi:phage portal protein [Photorhabdus tasmaniensis]|uniref:Phage portal protein n=1 Tax=Photorhabdus tasmaniensis TaxID=1004159 RepID=A0ABX0GF85_9GAMM|nr:phage portal protein [Photorhabdus tasmaniensis]NHB87177.1 phage portal protein [Photorhabdus tasmaniensis]